MRNHPRVTSIFWLIASTVSSRLEARNLSHSEFADEIGISRSYWSQILHRKRHLTPQVRRWLLASPTLEGLSEAELWERVPIQESP
jgi:transcriptional regulator with XRE-family HTH domain